MIRRLLAVHLCLLAVAAADVCPLNPPAPHKSMPANTAGGQLHITQSTSPDTSYNPNYVLEVTDFGVDTPVKSFTQYVGSAITTQSICKAHVIYHVRWLFDADTGCWVMGPAVSKTGVWKPGNVCDLKVEESLPTKKADGTPAHYTKVRVEGAVLRKLWLNGKEVIVKRLVRAGVISF